MEGKKNMVAKMVAALLMAAAMVEGTYAAVYIVGDATGWTVPPGGNDDFYDNWDSQYRFIVGDVLVFNFGVNVNDTVAQVTEAAYESCNTANPISVQTTSPASFLLNSTGDHYFISTVGNRCSRGQRLDVEVNPAPVSPPGATPTVPSSPGRAYIVGNATGWTVPPSGDDDFYDDWDSQYRFVVGDALVFNFGVNDTVAQVTEAAYDSCNTANPISVQTISPATFILNSTGDHYFISTVGNRCSLGQRLDVEVNPAPVSPSPPVATPSSPGRIYIVGNTSGWTVPPRGDDADDFYDNWASQYRFVVGDVLVFNFAVNDTVAQVTENAHDDCITANPISIQTISPASFILNSTDDHYFISTVGNRCSLGQRLDVEVFPAPVSPPIATPPTSPPSASPPTTTTTPTSPPTAGPASSPTSGPTSPPTSAPTSPPAGTNTQGSPNSASTKAVAAFSVVFISIATAFLF